MFPGLQHLKVVGANWVSRVAFHSNAQAALYRNPAAVNLAHLTILGVQIADMAQTEFVRTIDALPHLSYAHFSTVQAKEGHNLYWNRLGSSSNITDLTLDLGVARWPRNHIWKSAADVMPFLRKVERLVVNDTLEERYVQPLAH